MKLKKIGAVLLAVLLVWSMSVSAVAVSDTERQNAIADTGAVLYQTVKKPQVASVGGEWTVLGLARSGYTVPDAYYTAYYETVVQTLKDCNGKLDEKKYTEYSRLVLALTAIGKNPSNVAGYDLLTPLGDYEKTVWQGINGPVFALLALDSGSYAMPRNNAAKTQATRALYIERILEAQAVDGGWSLLEEKTATSDPDITGMVLQALAKYQDRSDVKQATKGALSFLSGVQDKVGGFSAWGTANVESCAQVMVGLTELGISLNDARFVKNGHTLLDNLMGFYREEKGFVHTAGGTGSNLMATEQGFYALAAVQRAADGKPSLYRMTDPLSIGEGSGLPSVGLPNKHEDVKRVPVTMPGKSFADSSGDGIELNRAEIEALAARAIINGKTETSFAPQDLMTRAEFATITVRALGLPQKSVSQFEDVEPTQWFAPFVGSAYRYGIVKGTDSTHFTPQGTITRQEAAVMVARAAGLCGMETELTDTAVRDTLSQFGDYMTAASWAKPSLTFCYAQGILNAEDLSIRPTTPITRSEIAKMVYELLDCANLL